MEPTKTSLAKVKQLLDIAARIKANKPVSPDEPDLLATFEIPEKESKMHKILKAWNFFQTYTFSGLAPHEIR